jgi:pimeloyl-ACP methyl ester carboxylesterase
LSADSPTGADAYREICWSAADGLRLYRREYGDPASPRLPVLCLSGLTRNSNDFHDLATRLAGRGHRVLCPDYCGRGNSEYARDWRRYAPPALAADLVDLLAASHLTRVAVIGTSLGGLLAMALAVLRPSALAAAVLNDVGPELGGDGLERIIAFVGRDRPQPDWETACRTLQERFPFLGLEGPAAWMKFTRGTYRPGADGRLHFNWDVRLARTLRGGSARVPPLWPLFGALAGIPTLAVRGGASDVLTEGALARMQAARPDLAALTIPGVGHAPSLDEPASRSAIDALLARAEAAGSPAP